MPELNKIFLKSTRVVTTKLLKEQKTFKETYYEKFCDNHYYIR